MDLMNTQFWGNSLAAWLIAAGIALALVVILLALRRILSRQLRKLADRTTTKVDDLGADLVAGIRPIILIVIAFAFGANSLELPARLSRLLELTTVIALLIQAGISGNTIVTFLLAQALRPGEGADSGRRTSLAILGFVGRVVVTSLVALLILDNIGVNISALLAGLGIGGIAVALALQNVLGDLLASLAILLDKPFEAGDFIVVDQYLGTVEHVGLKTTRIRSLSGEQIIVSNTDLLGSRIRNYKRMTTRRIEFAVDVVYGTPAEKVKRIPLLLRQSVEAQPQARFDRAHLKEFGPSALVYQIVYIVESPDYNVYMDTQQRINFAIIEHFEREGIDFAFPTRTVHLASAPPSVPTSPAKRR